MIVASGKIGVKVMMELCQHGLDQGWAKFSLEEPCAEM